LKEFTIGNNDAGQRLDRFISKTAPLLPSSLAQKYIRIKRIKINHKSAAKDHKLAYGDTVQLYINDEFFEKTNEENAYLKITNPTLEIVYEDANIILINKPAGTLCHSDEKNNTRTLLSEIHAYLYKRGEWNPQIENSFAPALCNRIDRNTSGIVIAAKNAQALRIINEKIKEREIEKHYLAIVRGTPNPPIATLKAYLFKDAVKNQVFISKTSKPGTKTAIMEYITISANKGLSLLKCRLITGRTHQIRAQLASIGHPLLGDGKYGSERENKTYGEKYQALCSYKVIFAFKTDAGTLNYLNKKAFCVSGIPFIKKYFPSADISIDIS